MRRTRTRRSPFRGKLSLNKIYGSFKRMVTKRHISRRNRSRRRR